MMTEDIQGRKYTGFGRCIYCGSDGGETGLRDEHIVPFSLGGNAVIERASCAGCEKKTSRIEGYLSRIIFLQFRTHTGVQTRRPKERPKSFDAVLRIGERVIQARSIPVADHPMFLMMPILPIAALLRNDPPTAEFEGATVNLYYGGHDNMHERLGLDKSERLQMKIDTTMNLALIGQALAKISFCTAVATFGLDGFNHLDLPRLILGDYPFVPYYVGGDATQGTSLPDPDSLHHSDIEIVDVGGSRVLVVRLRLFANHNATVTVSQPTKWLLARRIQPPVFTLSPPGQCNRSRGKRELRGALRQRVVGPQMLNGARMHDLGVLGEQGIHHLSREHWG